MKCLKCGNDINEVTGLCSECDNTEATAFSQKKCFLSGLSSVTKAMMALSVCLVLGLGFLTFFFFDLKGDFNDLSEQLKAANETIENNQDNIRMLNAELLVKENEIYELTGDLSSLSGSVRDINSDIAMLDKSIDDIDSSLSDTSGQIDSLKGELDQTTAQSTELQKQIADINRAIVDSASPYLAAYNKARQSIVNIVIRKKDGWTYAGSGIIANTAGYVITNYHVAENGQVFTVHLDDGTQHRASFVTGNKDRDVAILKFNDPVEGLVPASFGSIENVHVGDAALALGYPASFRLDGDPTLTVGFVSALRDYDDLPWIQIDTVLNPGNSGGALLNQDGDVIGIPTFGLGGYEDLNFAVPIDAAFEYLEKALSYEK